jgi:hypothetical protein
MKHRFILLTSFFFCLLSQLSAFPFFSSSLNYAETKLKNTYVLVDTLGRGIRPKPYLSKNNSYISKDFHKFGMKGSWRFFAKAPDYGLLTTDDTDPKTGYYTQYLVNIQTGAKISKISYSMMDLAQTPIGLLAVGVATYYARVINYTNGDIQFLWDGISGYELSKCTYESMSISPDGNDIRVIEKYSPQIVLFKHYHRQTAKPLPSYTKTRVYKTLPEKKLHPNGRDDLAYQPEKPAPVDSLYIFEAQHSLRYVDKAGNTLWQKNNLVYPYGFDKKQADRQKGLAVVPEINGLGDCLLVDAQTQQYVIVKASGIEIRLPISKSDFFLYVLNKATVPWVFNKITKDTTYIAIADENTGFVGITSFNTQSRHITSINISPGNKYLIVSYRYNKPIQASSEPEYQSGFTLYSTKGNQIKDFPMYAEEQDIYFSTHATDYALLGKELFQILSLKDGKVIAALEGITTFTQTDNSLIGVLCDEGKTFVLDYLTGQVYATLPALPKGLVLMYPTISADAKDIRIQAYPERTDDELEVDEYGHDDTWDVILQYHLNEGGSN